ncbi:hypothetical protein ACWFR1_11980 [Streptomyces sp. NPDC055103]
MAIFEALSSALGSFTALVTNWPGPRNRHTARRGLVHRTDPPPITNHGTVTVTGDTNRVVVQHATGSFYIAQVSGDQSELDSTVARELPAGWVEALDELPPDERREAARRMWAVQVTRIRQHSPESHSDESDVESTVERQLPTGWLEHLDKLSPEQRLAVAKKLSEALDSGISPDLQPLRRVPLPDSLVVADPMSQGVDLRFTDPPEPLSLEESAAVADRSGNSIDHALAMLFLRLGPPPEPTELDYAPAGNGGGGVQQ